MRTPVWLFEERIGIEGHKRRLQLQTWRDSTVGVDLLYTTCATAGGDPFIRESTYDEVSGFVTSYGWRFVCQVSGTGLLEQDIIYISDYYMYLYDKNKVVTMYCMS